MKRFDNASDMALYLLLQYAEPMSKKDLLPYVHQYTIRNFLGSAVSGQGATELWQYYFQRTFLRCQKRTNCELGRGLAVKDFLGAIIGLGLMVPAIIMVRITYESRPGSPTWVSLCITIGKLLLKSVVGIFGFFSLEFLWFGMFVIGFGIVLISVLELFGI